MYFPLSHFVWTKAQAPYLTIALVGVLLSVFQGHSRFFYKTPWTESLTIYRQSVAKLSLKDSCFVNKPNKLLGFLECIPLPSPSCIGQLSSLDPHNNVNLLAFRLKQQTNFNSFNSMTLPSTGCIVGRRETESSQNLTYTINRVWILLLTVARIRDFLVLAINILPKNCILESLPVGVLVGTLAKRGLITFESR